jgi:hypothetical protein
VPKQKGAQLVSDLRPHTAKPDVGFAAINKNLQEIVEALASSDTGRAEIREVESLSEEGIIEKYANGFGKQEIANDFDEKFSEEGSQN